MRGPPPSVQPLMDQDIIMVGDDDMPEDDRRERRKSSRRRSRSRSVSPEFMDVHCTVSPQSPQCNNCWVRSDISVVIQWTAEHVLVI